ncbi:steroid delta5-4-isomerase [Fusarium pseudoanthophilum]|uniref:Steroid delta5-4-isomerase n=1 Tax=Fusarium pseudoanthophilum TaxID=48495 RepID=A0A8H5Q3B2_9HYPO|nr:steroid delta5-4-isomerase [Fusarium pseudoanthophilum]
MLIEFTESASINMSSPETQAITAVLHAYGSALKERNVKETVALYTSDGVIMPPHFSASAGTQALTETYERIFNSIQLTITFDIDEIVLMSPEWAFARTTAEGTKTMLQTQTSEPHSNQELFILKKEGGSWKIARYAFSTMKPLVKDGIRRS